MFNYNSLSTSSQAKLDAIMLKDGNAKDLSAVDLAKASKSEIQDLVKSLKVSGYTSNEEELGKLIQQLTMNDSISVSKGTTKAFVIDDIKGIVTTNFSFVEDDTQENMKNELREAREGLMNKGNVYKTNTSMLFSTSKIEDSSIGSDWKINKAVKARETLKNKYNFDLKNPYDLKEIKKFADKNLTRDQIPDFIENYLAANYEHSGGGTEWHTMAKVSPEKTFFGTPQLPKLPDGRHIVDCQGYAKAGEILFDTMIPGSDQKNVFYTTIRTSAKGTKENKNGDLIKNGETVGHELGFMRINDKFYIIDNRDVTEVKLTEKEIKNIEKLYSPIFNDYGPKLMSLINKTKLDKEEFPSMYKYFDENWDNWRNTKIYWDDNDALSDG